MKSRKKLDARCMIRIALAAGMAGAAAGATAAPIADAVEAQAHEAWKEAITRTSAPAEGCFHAAYPSLEWVRVQCYASPHRYLAPSRKVNAMTVQSLTVGNGNDYVAETSRNISQAVGSFPKVTDVIYERGVCDLVFGGCGVSGPNEYTLQVNSQIDLTTSACQGHAGCTIWQQFGYATNWEVQGTAGVFISYWLLNWGSTDCPSGWTSFVGPTVAPTANTLSCVINSNYTPAPNEPIGQLVNEKMSASAVAGGNDTNVFTDGNTAWSFSAPDSVLHLATAWDQAEFNVFGDAGGSRADFNPGASVTVKLAVTSGSTTAPTCVADSGSTAETNNLTAGSCSASGGTTPYIEFSESIPKLH
jgi:hypothetical protein